MAYKEIVGLFFLLYVATASGAQCYYRTTYFSGKITYETKYCYKCCSQDCCADTGPSDSSDVGGIIGAVCGSLLVAIIIFTALCCIYMKGKRARNTPNNIPPTAAVSVVSSGQDAFALRSVQNQQMRSNTDAASGRNKAILLVIKAPRSSKPDSNTSHLSPRSSKPDQNTSHLPPMSSKPDQNTSHLPPMSSKPDQNTSPNS